MSRDIKEFVKAEAVKAKSPEERKEYAEALAELSRTPDGRREIAEIIVEDVTDKYDRIDLLNEIGEVRTYEVGEEPNFKVRKGLRGTIHAHGSIAERTAWQSSVVRPTINLLSVNPEALLLDLQAGRIGTITDMQADAIDAAQRLIGKTVWDLLKTAVSAGANYFTVSAVNWAAAGATAKTAIKNATRYVADKGGGIKAIVGRLPALFPLMDLEGFSAGTSQQWSEEYKRQLELQGRVGTFLGSPVVYLEDYFEDRLGTEYTSMIDSDNLFVVPKNLGVVTAYVGGFEAQESLSADTLIYNVHVYRQFGQAVVHNLRVARLNLNA